MTGLRELTLANCKDLTDTGIHKLSALTQLQVLSLIRCRKVSEEGLAFLQGMPELHSLTVYLCAKVWPLLYTAIAFDSCTQGLGTLDLRLPLLPSLRQQQAGM